jgi:FAD/FMN-containing dehydrogenase
VNDLLNDLSDIPHVTDARLVRQKSRDFFWYSPVLNRQLQDCTAQAVLSPRDEADVIRIAAACVRHKVPITARGGGTGNYGQAVPLQGGVILDMTALDAIEWQRPGMVRVGPGRKLLDIDRETRPNGWELRMHPSTKRTATIGGFVGGGSGGIGSVTWGGLREPGNVSAARIVTMEETPRVLDLREAETGAVNHAYGTTGLITALEMPLAPAWPWIDLIVSFPTFMDAVRFGYAVALADGVVKKLVTPIAWPIPESFRQVRGACPDDRGRIRTGVQVTVAARHGRRRDHAGTADQGGAGRGAAVRIHLEPHHVADAETRPDRDLLAGAAPRRPAAGQRGGDRRAVRRRADPAPGIPARRREGDRQRPADRALYHR